MFSSISHLLHTSFTYVSARSPKSTRAALCGSPGPSLFPSPQLGASVSSPFDNTYHSPYSSTRAYTHISMHTITAFVKTRAAHLLHSSPREFVLKTHGAVFHITRPFSYTIHSLLSSMDIQRTPFVPRMSLFRTSRELPSM
jgi:hypothetical protein